MTSTRVELVKRAALALCLAGPVALNKLRHIYTSFSLYLLCLFVIAGLTLWVVSFRARSNKNNNGTEISQSKSKPTNIQGD